MSDEKKSFFDLQDHPVMSKAFNAWGIQAQAMVAVEECAELIKGITKWMNRGADDSNVVEETADVIIMANQLAFFLGRERVEEVIQAKLAKLDKKLLKYEDHVASSFKAAIPPVSEPEKE